METPPDSRVVDVDVHTMKTWLDAGDAVLVDVREPDEYAQERIPGAVHVPLSAFNPALLPDAGDKKLVIGCMAGPRSTAVCEFLASQGHGEAYNLDGGLIAWKEAGFPTES